MLDAYGREVTKAIANTYESLYPPDVTGKMLTGKDDRLRRGYSVYTMSQLMGVMGRDRHGDMISGTYEQSLFYLSIDERLATFRLCAPVHAVVVNRMNRISGIPFNIVSKRHDEDRVADKMKMYYTMFKEFEKSDELKFMVARNRLYQKMSAEFPDLLPDGSNFKGCLWRWKKRIASSRNDLAERIKEWCLRPNLEETWEAHTKKYVQDLLIHGQCSHYKQKIDDKIENVYILPGGTVMPLKERFVGGSIAYAQIMPGMEPKIYYGDELSYSTYIPSSARAYGMVPLEALINKIAETLLFDKLMAEQADGTKPPEKMVVITDNFPFGRMDESELTVPILTEEQVRIETKLNTPKKNSVATFSGNNIEVVDLSRENTMEFQNQRQKDIREEVALVYGATNMEMNLSGSETTSGRSTAEAQEEIMHSRAILPILQQIETVWTNEIIPYRFGWGYKLEFEAQQNEEKEWNLIQRKVASGVITVNEVREEDLSKDPIEGDEFDKPAGGVKQPSNGQQPGQDQLNPQYTREV